MRPTHDDSSAQVCAAPSDAFHLAHPVPTVVVDAKWTVTALSAAFCDVFGCSASELVGQKVDAALDRVEPRQGLAELKQALKSRKAVGETTIALGEVGDGCGVERYHVLSRLVRDHDAKAVGQVFALVATPELNPAAGETVPPAARVALGSAELGALREQLARIEAERDALRQKVSELEQQRAAMQQSTDGQQRVMFEVARLVDAALAGDLSARGDAAAVEGSAGGLIETVNALMDALIAPTQVAADYVARIASGELPPLIVDEYKGDFQALRDHLNQCVSTLSRFIAVMLETQRQQLLGDIDASVPVDGFSGFYRQMADSANNGLRLHIDNILKILGLLDKYADGDFTAQLRPLPGKQVLANQIMDKLRDNLITLQTKLGQMIARQQAGDLEARCDGSQLPGAYGELAVGMNQALDAVVSPLMETASLLAEYADGDLSHALRDLPGSQIVLTESMNGIRASLETLVSESERLTEAATQGALTVRADTGHVRGSYRDVLDGFNRTLDGVVGPLGEVSRVLGCFAAYDLTARPQGEYAGAYAELVGSLKTMADALRDALGVAAQSAAQITSASQEIASGSQAVAQGASEQASSLEETSSSLEEIASMTKQNADNTQEAKALAEATKAVAERGTGSMVRLNEAMKKIRTASEGTAQIIRDINEIAFQTNLLALNAAVEAARAGDAGRGFAVVAEEVRSLAQRSKEAARKTEALIHESVGLAESGQVISKEMDGNLSGIVDSVAKVTSIVAEIAAASLEQARGIEQVNQAVSQMDQVTQQAAATAEQSSSAAEELNAQATELELAIARFVLGTGKQASDRRGKAGRVGVHQGVGASHRTAAGVRGRQAAGKVAPLSRAGRANGARDTGIKLSAEELIPLDSDPDFKDF